MSKRYDETMKKFVGANPQHFADWLRPWLTFTEALPTELKSRSIFVDALCKAITPEGNLMLLHIEFQRNIRAGIPERLLEYNVLARRENRLPVCSYVIYLIDDGTVEESPLIWRSDDGSEILRFHYESIRMWETDPNEFTSQGREGILPLVLLTRNHGKPSVVEMVIKRLVDAHQEDLLPATEMLASLVFKGKPDESDWLARRFSMLRDILRETEPYQRILNEGRQEGLQEGRQEGRQEGELRGMSLVLLRFVQRRFPDLVPFAQEQIARVTDRDRLQDAVLEMAIIQSSEEALQLLKGLIPSEQKHS